MNREQTPAFRVRDYWCPICGMVRKDIVRPICRHGVPDPTSVVRTMDDLPTWHPLWEEGERSAREKT